MPVDDASVLDLIRTLTANSKLRKTAAGSATGGLIAGTCAVVGGLLGGPPGLAVGGAAGGALAAGVMWNRFESVPQLLMEMNADERQRLVDAVRGVLGCVDASTAAQLAALVLADPNLRRNVIETVSTFIQSAYSLKMEILD